MTKPSNLPETTTEKSSKSEKKREMHALFALGKRLTQLPIAKLRELEINDTLLLALEETQRIRSNGALKRHYQHIAKLLRDVDTDPLEQVLIAIDSSNQANLQKFHEIETWRSRLLTTGDQGKAAMTEWMSLYPDTDAQQLRQLVRQTIKERTQQKAPTHYRKLFQFLKDIQMHAHSVLHS